MPKIRDGPSPAAYELRPLLGYERHDLTKYRHPAYSMGVRVKPFAGQGLPGPKYLVEKITAYGKDTTPEYSIKSRHFLEPKSVTPGPAAYKVEDVKPMSSMRAPVYSMFSRLQPLKDPNPTPAPNVYLIPSTIGPKVPDMKAGAAYSMSFRQKISEIGRSPGPAAYPEGKIDNIKHAPPKFSMCKRIDIDYVNKMSPGPKYLPKIPAKPGYSFGLRTDNDPYITTADNIPCIYDECP